MKPGLIHIILFLLLAFGFLFVVSMIIFIVRNNQQRKRMYLLLQQQVLELENAKTNLKAIQEQLKQSERMASLGELTAGIAHEIQNPLNFVNNFSETSQELVTELLSGPFKNLPETCKPEAEEIINDLAQNLQKISFHGKRADSIVKGMLQHSRGSSDQKAPEDINALTDEYLRLSYHGIRAKDKTFNVTMKTDFDTRVSKININRQDIGRVLINLFSNAFYAVHEKKKELGDKFDPVVSVSTQKLAGVVRICVRDNGKGISAADMENIFHPFFTTKPAGEGTGLGLSLSHDIITKGHGGTIKAETREGEGTEFIIELPDSEG